MLLMALLLMVVMLRLLIVLLVMMLDIFCTPPRAAPQGSDRGGGDRIQTSSTDGAHSTFRLSATIVRRGCLAVRAPKVVSVFHGHEFSPCSWV